MTNITVTISEGDYKGHIVQAIDVVFTENSLLSQQQKDTLTDSLTAAVVDVLLPKA